MRNKFYFSWILLVALIINVKSQSLTLSGGKSENSSGGSISSSIGLSPSTIASNGNYTITSGTQQPFEISMHLSTIDITNKSIDVKIYPNPFSENVFVRFSENKSKDDYAYKIFDQNGRIINKGGLKNPTNILNLQNLTTDNYILEITQSGKTINTYKLIKK